MPMLRSDFNSCTVAAQGAVANDSIHCCALVVRSGLDRFNALLLTLRSDLLPTLQSVFGSMSVDCLCGFDCSKSFHADAAISLVAISLDGLQLPNNLVQPIGLSPKSPLHMHTRHAHSWNSVRVAN